jgi:hypothetical protein
MTRPADPSLPGPHAFDAVVYAAPGLNYAAVPPLSQYVVYDSPDAGYDTGSIDISDFANLGSAPWPFPNTAVPINGQLRVPRGRGPFPLALFAHGNHNPLVDSTPGYLYLCELLASHGIIAATIDVNFLNGFNFGENDARAIIHLEHLKQFRAWNSTANHPLCGQIDLTRIMIVGHSRGGEGVGHASYFNRLGAIQPTLVSPVVPLDGSAGLGPYGFRLSAVMAIAPTDAQYVPLTGPTVVPDAYFLIHGSRDGDVFTFSGYDTFNRAHAVNLANPTVSDFRPKGLLWVYWANHNQFNSVWPSEFSGAQVLPRGEQEGIAKVYIGALAQAKLLDRHEYDATLKDHAAAHAWLPPLLLCVSQYQDPRRIFVQHEQEGPGFPQISLPIQGVILADSVGAMRGLFDLANTFGPQFTYTLRLDWNTSPARLLMNVDPTTFAAHRFSVLSFRAGQSVDPANVVDRDQDFTLEISTGMRTFTARASSFHRLLYPDTAVSAGKIVMQTVRVPIDALIDRGLDPADIRQITLSFDQRPSGSIYVGEVQFSD